MNCPHCQSHNDPDAVFCGECGRSLVVSLTEAELQQDTADKETKDEGLGESAPRKKWRRPLSVGLILFCSLLLAAAAFLVYERTRAAVYVNGEKISISQWQSEVDAIRPQIEAQYGAQVFGGPEGTQNYRAFRHQVLQTLIIDRLIRQEAQKLGVKVTGEEVQSRLIQIVGAGADPEQFLKQQGITKASAVKILERELLQERLISSQLSRQGFQISDANIQRQAGEIYLSGLWSRAQIRYADKELTAPAQQTQNTSGGCACCSSKSAGGQTAMGGSCGSGSPTNKPLDPQVEQAAREAALKAYREKNGENLVSAVVSDRGCHIQMDIMEQGKILKSYAYREGKAQEIN